MYADISDTIRPAELSLFNLIGRVLFVKLNAISMKAETEK